MASAGTLGGCLKLILPSLLACNHILNVGDGFFTHKLFPHSSKLHKTPMEMIFLLLRIHFSEAILSREVSLILEPFTVQNPSNHIPVQIKKKQRWRNSQDVLRQYHVVEIWPVFTRNALNCGSWANKRSSWSREDMIVNACGNLPLVWLWFSCQMRMLLPGHFHTYTKIKGPFSFSVWHHIFKNKALLQAWVCAETRNTE